MVLFYDEYSSKTFASTVKEYLSSEFVQPTSGQIETSSFTPSTEADIIVQSVSAQIVQIPFGQMPKILELTSLSLFPGQDIKISNSHQ